MSEIVTKIPQEARSSVSEIPGVSLDVISELFSRIKLPDNLQAQFWDAMSVKNVKYFPWHSIRIKTRRDGTKEVIVFASDGTHETFQVPDDLTDEQLEELKRAQSANLPGIIEYQVEEKGKRPVTSVEVFEKEEKKAEEKKEKQFF